jgi:hypothetical protein
MISLRSKSFVSYAKIGSKGVESVFYNVGGEPKPLQTDINQTVQAYGLQHKQDISSFT